MIFAERKPMAEIMENLRGHSNVLLAGCACCAAECAAGGEKEVQTLAPLIRLAAGNEGRPIRVRPVVLERQCEWEFVEELAEIAPKFDAILSLACGIGVQAVAERFSSIPVYPGVNTSALTIRQEPGLWISRCEACGDCVLGETFGLCPVARCAKSLMNGPCGGTRSDGKCEVDPQNDCVWKLIVERAEARGGLDSLKAVRKTRDWSRSRHGGPKRVLREDIRV